MSQDIDLQEMFCRFAVVFGLQQLAMVPPHTPPPTLYWRVYSL